MHLENYHRLINELKPAGAKLVAVSKTKPVGDIRALYDEGQRIFGENKVQEMADKQLQLPADIQWHLIGHLQTNKVKYIAPFVSLIHSVDSLKLLAEIDKQAAKNGRIINCLLQIFIADEPTKFGLDEAELHQLLGSPEFKTFKNVSICGLMGMATNTEDLTKVETEFEHLKQIFEKVKAQYFSEQPIFKELSMGMSSDYKIALKHGATLIRVGSMLFGDRS